MIHFVYYLSLLIVFDVLQYSLLGCFRDIARIASARSEVIAQGFVNLRHNMKQRFDITLIDDIVS